MKHLITVISTVIFFIGVELISGLVSSWSTGLHQAFTNPSRKLVFGIGFMVLGSITMFLIISRNYYYESVLYSRQCPICHSNIKRRRRRIKHRVVSKVLGKSISGARCNDCGWEGVVYTHL